ncbi:MAG: NAD(P)/FAD-dependent oxidoreductase [Candidatus Bipolaricaulia bacterium]
MTKTLIIGNGVAGDSAARIVSRKREDREIKIFTGEKYPFYQRTRLGEVLSGDTTAEDLILHDTGWYRNHDIDLHLETWVKKISPDKKFVKTKTGNKYSYDKLLLAPGAKPAIPPIEGLDKENVFALRTLNDVQKIVSRLSEVEEALVIGGGLLGLESAYALNKRGLTVKVVEALPLIMGKQLDKVGSRYVKSRLEDTGIEFKLETKVKKLAGEDSISSAVLSSGESIATDLAIISAGITPRTKLAESAGLETSRGILVDKHLRTSRPEIFAAGDAIELGGNCYGIWPPALEQGKIAGNNLIGEEEEYNGSLSYYKLKVANIDLISAGNRDKSRADKVLAQEDETNQTYKKFFLNESNELIGAILVGDKACYPIVLNGLRNRADFDEINDNNRLMD